MMTRNMGDQLLNKCSLGISESTGYNSNIQVNDVAKDQITNMDSYLGNLDNYGKCPKKQDCGMLTNTNKREVF